MYRCLQLAKKGLGNTAPNPMVGAVLVYKNRIIGEGFTSKYGGNHAEVNCINSVKENDKKLIHKAILYVSLEPCSHFGKTPPCSNLIVQSNIKEVVIGVVDTNSLVSGKGIEHLKKNGIKVLTGVLQNECLVLNKRFFTFHNKKRPYIFLKWAKSKDNFIGKVKKDKIEPVWISNKYSQQLVHKWRTEEQAILVGTNTVLSDNPFLTSRKFFGKNPVRIIIDRKLRIPSNFNVFNKDSKTIVINEKKTDNIENIFYEKIDFSKFTQEINRICVKHEIQSVIVEGGKQILETFIKDKNFDEAFVFTGNKILKNGIKSPVLNDVTLIDIKKIDDDFLFNYKN